MNRFDVDFLGIHLGTATDWDSYEGTGEWDGKQYSNFQSACSLPDCAELVLDLEEGTFKAYMHGDENNEFGEHTGGTFRILDILTKKQEPHYELGYTIL